MCVISSLVFYTWLFISNSFFLLNSSVKFSSLTFTLKFAVGHHLITSGFTGQLNKKDEESDGSSIDMEDEGGDSDNDSDDGIASNDSKMSEMERTSTVVDFDKEVDIARKVLNNLVTSSSKDSLSLQDDGVPPKSEDDTNVDETINVQNKLPVESAIGSDVIKPEKSGTNKQTDSEEELQRTVFISNLPFDIDNKEVKERFSAFGEVQSFIPVLHPVTKY